MDAIVPRLESTGQFVIARLAELTPANRVRRNHALEHATITVVTERHPTVFLTGRSNRNGFYIFGEFDTDELQDAIAEGLQRLRAGEAELAIHPRCGTNLAVAGILSGSAAALAAQLKPRQNRYSYAILAALLSLLVSPQVGTVVQRHLTTLANPDGLEVERPVRRRLFGRPYHWVRTRST